MARKKWSLNEQWLGARITGPVGGTLSEAMQRARKNTRLNSVTSIRTTSYIQSGLRVRVRS